MMVERTFAGAYPRQDAFITDFWDNSNKFYVITGGNRSGKTYCARACVGWYLRERAKHNEIYWCIAPSLEKSVERQQRDIWEVIPKYAFGKVNYNAKTGFGGINPTVILNFEDGRQVIVRFKSEAQWRNDPKAFEAEQVKGVWIDESIAEDAFNALIPRTIDQAGWLMGSMIPDLAWMHDRFEDARPDERVTYAKISMSDNPYLPPEEVEDAKNWPEEMYQVRFLGNFAFLSSLVYTQFKKEYAPAGHLCKPFKIPPYWPRYRSLDWGTRSPTVCLWGAVSPNNTLYIYREYYAPGKTVQEHVRSINAMSDGETFRGMPIIDPAAFSITQANMTSIADEFARHGFPVMPGIKASSQRAFEATVEKVKDWLMARNNGAPMLQVFDDCHWIIKEFRRWSLKVDKFGNPDPQDRYEKKNDHCLDALRYMICTSHPTFGQREIFAESTAD